MINILILEDQKDSREALEKMIESYGRAEEVEVDAASSYDEAMEMLDNARKTYNGFFVDINLNVEDEDDRSGIEFARKIRENRKYEFTPIIIVIIIINGNNFCLILS